LQALSTAELCVCDLAVIANISQSATSHQLRILRQAHFVKYRKEGKVVYYSLYDEHIRSVIDLGLQHINEK
jgi:ArsR family transcriptional regulator